jgi:superfamily II DNA or RNA helicase
MAHPDNPNFDVFTKIPFWEHQVEAIKATERYIQHNLGEKVDTATLIHMPTGTGKTGVMAGLLLRYPGTVKALILTPRKALRDQLHREVSSEFFTQFGIDEEAVPHQAHCFRKQAYDLALLEVDTPTVFVSTIQKLDYLRKNDKVAFGRLVDQISLVIFDEGHYEPSLSWSLTVREFKCPKVLFTATPYRNDFKHFKLDLRHSYSYTFTEAVEDHTIRSIEMIPRDKGNPDQFVQDVLKFYRQQFPKNKSRGKSQNEKDDEVRILVRCRDRVTIRKLGYAFRRAGISCVAIHDKFEDRDTGALTWQRRSVPDPQQTEAQVWIHQYKLMEGIDEPRFRLLAIHDAFSDTRSLIQQVGRLTRNTQRHPGQSAYVLDYSGGEQRQLWERFIQYDKELTKKPRQERLNLAVGPQWFEQFMYTPPNLVYIEKLFRAPFDIYQAAPLEKIRLPQKVNFIEKEADFQLEEFVECSCERLEFLDCIVKSYEIDERTWIVLYISFRNSPYLERDAFVEDHLGALLVREYPNEIAYFNTGRFVPLNDEHFQVGRAVPAAQMKRVFRNDPDTRMTRMSWLNSNVGVRNITSRSFTANSIEQIPPGFDDYAQIVTTAEGYTRVGRKKRDQTIERRYIGFGTGRIAQGSRFLSLRDYLVWIDQVHKRLGTRRSVLDLFHRYAPESTEASEAQPINILIDLGEVDECLVTNAIDGLEPNQPIQMEDRCLEIDQQGRFEVTANGKICPVTITYDEVKKRYLLSSEELEAVYLHKDEPGWNLIDYLNRNQSFRIIPQQRNLIYTLGNFYRPDFQTGKRFNLRKFALDDVLVASTTLAEISSEKGDYGPDHPPSEGTWQADSLFGIIARLGENSDVKQYFGDPDILVCDDIGTELADFILADTRRQRVVFIHAKASKDFRPYGATAIQEVVSQGVKNLGYLNLYSSEAPQNLKKWDGKWTLEGHQVDRIVLPARNGKKALGGKEIWRQIRRLLDNPNVNREVWLFMGQTLSKEALMAQLTGEPAPAARQTVHLLRAALATVLSIGGKFRVFCAP